LRFYFSPFFSNKLRRGIDPTIVQAPIITESIDTLCASVLMTRIELGAKVVLIGREMDTRMRLLSI
jgi:hypothetical protein